MHYGVRLKMKKYIWISVLVSLLAISVTALLRYPQTVKIEGHSEGDMSEFTVTIFSNGEIAHYPLSSDGIAVVGHGVGGSSKGLMAIHDWKYIAWEGMFNGDQSTSVKVDLSNKHEMSKSVHEWFVTEEIAE